MHSTEVRGRYIPPPYLLPCPEEITERESLRKAKIAKRIEANNIVGFMRFRDYGGSQPGRHSWILAGKPLYYWKMKVACDCKYLDKVIVFTDIKEALKMAEEMSDKFVPIEQSLTEALEPSYVFVDDLKTPQSRRITERTFEELAASIGLKDPVKVYLNVPSPLESTQSITKLIEWYFGDDIAEVAMIATLTEGPHWTLDPRNPKYGMPLWYYFKARQMRPLLYRVGGSRIEMYPWHNRQRTLLVPIPEWEVFEVHSREDLERAELFFNRRLKG